jgi:hypothetical protein
MTLLLPGSRSITVLGPMAFCVAIYVYLSTSINISTASMGHQLLELQNMVDEMAAASSSTASSVVEFSVPTNYTPILQGDSNGTTGASLELPPPPPIDVCFVSSVFAPTVHTADRPHDFSKFELTNTSSFQFFIYTNLEDLESPGWTKVLRKFTTYRRFITQSRWGKFMAWKDPELRACQVIFYFDGYFAPNANGERLVMLAETIKKSEFGLAQRLSPKRRTALQEFAQILKGKKDIEKNVNASIAWLHAQPDFHNNCTLYKNANFGYDPNNAHFREAAQYFWDHYSKEEDSWRDQPLWCHTLAHFHVKPILMGQLFYPNWNRMGHKKHKYSVAQDNDAGAASTSLSTANANASIS